MFKKYLSNLTRYILTPVFTWVIYSSTAHAQDASVVSTFLGHGLFDLLAEAAAWISHQILTIMSLWVALTGALLNVSINLTLHIKDFVDSTSGIYLVWQTLRDISGMFIIFLLLYASIKIILGFDSVGGAGHLIKNVVIVGVLINFSFFFVSLMIDASNVVSLALYNGIVGNPTSQDAATENAKAALACGSPAGTINSCTIAYATTNSSNTTNGGMSAIFMNILAPQGFYNDANKGATDASNSSYGKDQAAGILIQGIIGSVIMFTVGFSFLLASLAFVVRLVILIFLLAFSPLLFASWVIPGLDEKAKDFTNHLKSQLIFMPVYLLLLYAALRVAAGSTVFTNLNTNSLASDSLTAYTVLAINDIFIIFMLNLPLVVALSMGGAASKWMKLDKFNAGAIWKRAGGGTAGYVGTRSFGKWAGQLDKAVGNTRIGNTLLARDIRSATTGAVAKSKMGGGRSYEDLTKAQGEVGRKRQEIDRKIHFNETIANPLATHSMMGGVIKSMSEKERLGLGKKHLTDPKVIAHLKKSDFDAIKKSEDFSPDDVKEILGKRKEVFQNAIRNGQTDTIKSMLGAYDGEELLGIDSAELTSTNLLQHLNQGQLKQISDKTNNTDLKRNIANTILDMAANGVPVPTEGYIHKNRREWGL